MLRGALGFKARTLPLLTDERMDGKSNLLRSLGVYKVRTYATIHAYIDYAALSSDFFLKLLVLVCMEIVGRPLGSRLPAWPDPEQAGHLSRTEAQLVVINCVIKIMSLNILKVCSKY